MACDDRAPESIPIDGEREGNMKNPADPEGRNSRCTVFGVAAARFIPAGCITQCWQAECIFCSIFQSPLPFDTFYSKAVTHIYMRAAYTTSQKF